MIRPPLRSGYCPVCASSSSDAAQRLNARDARREINLLVSKVSEMMNPQKLRETCSATG